MFLNNKEYSSFWVNGKEYVKGLLNGKQIFGETLHFHTAKILARATAIGATPPTNIANFDYYVRSMYDFWITYCDVFFRFRGTGDTNFKRINLANPDGVLADFYGGYTLDNIGFKGNGSNAYIDTNFNPSLLISGQKYKLNDASRGYIIESSTANGALDGVNGLASANQSYYGDATTSVIINSQVQLNISYANNRTGLTVINRISSSDLSLIKKDEELFRTQTSFSITNANQLILRRASIYGSGRISTYFIGKSIPFSTSQLIRTAENADMANLGIPQIA